MADNRFFPVVAYCGGIMTCSGETTHDGTKPIDVDKYGYCKPTSGNVKNITDSIASWSGGSGSAIAYNNNTDADAYIFVKDVSGISATTLHVFKTKCSPKMICTYNNPPVTGQTKIINNSDYIWKKLINSGTSEQVTVLGDMNSVSQSKYRIGSYEEGAIYQDFPKGADVDDPHPTTVEFSFANAINSADTLTLSKEDLLSAAYIFDNTLLDNSLNDNHFIGETEERHETNADARPYMKIYQEISGKTYYSGGTSLEDARIGYVSATSYCRTSDIQGKCGFIKRVPQDAINITNDGMFKDCVDLKSCKMPCQIRTINKDTFRGCTSLTSYTEAPNWVTHIGQNAFSGCTSLSEATFGRYIKAISAHSFDTCTNLQAIKWNDFKPTSNDKAGTTCGLTRIGNYAFYNCNKLNKTKFSGNTKYDGIYFPSGITEIGDAAFSGCTSITTLHLNDVRKVGANAFKDCLNLTTIINIDNLDIVYKNSFENVGKGNPGGTIIEESTLSKVEQIQDNGFEEVHFVGTDIILTSCTSIGESAFYNAKFDQNVTVFPTNCSDCYIEDYAFKNAKIGGNITVNSDFGKKDAYSNISSSVAQEIAVSGNVTVHGLVGFNAFLNANITGNVQVDGYVYANAFQFANIGGSVTVNGSEIGSESFRYAILNDGININGTNVYIVDGAFNWCTFPSNYTLDLTKVTRIGNDAFNYDNGSTIKTIILSAATIGNYAFYNLKGLEKICFSGNSNVGENVFYEHDSGVVEVEIRIKHGALVSRESNSFPNNNWVVFIDGFKGDGTTTDSNVTYYDGNNWGGIEIRNESGGTIYAHGH